MQLPFLTLSVRLNILLHGMTPLYFHIVNVCLHCAVTCLLMHTCERCVFEDSHLAFVTALLFAVHPVHTEAVSTWRPHTVSHWPRKCDRKGAHARVEPWKFHLGIWSTIQSYYQKHVRNKTSINMRNGSHFLSLIWNIDLSQNVPLDRNSCSGSTDLSLPITATNLTSSDPAPSSSFGALQRNMSTFLEIHLSTLTV